MPDIASCHILVDKSAYELSYIREIPSSIDIISSRYCYLSEKQINWPDSCRKYRAMIDSKTTEADLSEAVHS
mgnify:CR=1 FL=1